ncbi:hypothetical protein GNX71_18440 [Variovorax sp. RKNM96]|uniref:hypothetical protein n=1 Tax=Variovorax sp. RKNM96 TaxID=2681552 RepID=UPI00197FD0D7|nr:hypothetical protein [Variovorax sp. RKNM96]QSI31449.1 hypothetical protein GNX71_18440 [Variovorax sp. RKNM96]
MNIDSLNSVMPFSALHAAFTVLDAAQNIERPHLRVVGVAVLFNELCKRLGIDRGEMLNKADRIAKDADSNYTYHLRALHGYIDNELKGH